MKDFTKELRSVLKLSPDYVEPGKVRPLALAYLGDTIFDLYIRTRLVMTTRLQTNQMHSLSTGKVNAAAQARMIKSIMPMLSEEEMSVFKHARNQKPASLPKNMSPVDYKLATGLEALLGYLFLTEQDERLMELLNQMVAFENGKGTLS